MSNYFEIQDVAQFQSLMSADLERVSVLNFWAPWADPCKQMNEVFLELSKKYEKVLFLQIEAETMSDIAESFDIEAVPTFILLRGHTLLGRVDGADAVGLSNSLATHAHAPPRALSQTTEKPAAPTYQPEKQETLEELNSRLIKLMNQSKIMLFMKGSPDRPQCGFSRQMVALLKEQGAEFDHFDIYTDENVRQGLKTLNKWPTFPQLIVDGEFVGGLDVVREMVENGEFQEVISA